MEALIAVAVIVLLLFIIIAKGVIVVRQAEVVIIERLGTYSRTLQSGLHLIVPILDQTRAITWRNIKTDFKGATYISEKTEHRIDLREAVYDFPRQNVITKDNVNVQINALLYFQIMDPVKSIYEIENLPDAIEKLTQTTLRNVIGELELDESLSSRDTINLKLRTILDEATNKWGVKVNRVELQDINPPEDIKEAMEKQMRAERDRRAAVLEAEGQKKSKILEAEGFRESKIKMAEGEKQSEILKAEGQSQARIRIAEAEAEAIKLITQAIDAENGDPINYLIASKYIETLQEMVSGQDNKTVYMPFEATGVLSSLGGIKEMLNGK